MASKVEIMMEAERRGILPPDKAAILAEARKRGLIKDQQQQTPNETSNVEKAVNLGAAFVQGRTFGTGPKIAAGIGAAFAKPVLETAELVSGTDWESPSYSDLYQRGVEIYSEPVKKAREDTPWLALGAELAGGLKTGGQVAGSFGKYGTQAVDKTANVLRGAGLGAGAGNIAAKSALGGVLAEGASRAYQAAEAPVGGELDAATNTDVPVAGVLGAAFPIIGAGYGALKNRFGSIGAKGKTEIDKVVAKLRKDFPDDVTFNQKLQEYANSAGISLAEIGDKNIVSLAKGVAQYPSGEVATEKFLTNKIEKLPTRIKQAASKYIHTDKDFYATADDIVERGRAVAKPLYKDAFAQNKSMSSKRLNAVLGTPEGRRALKTVSTHYQDMLKMVAKPDPELTQIARDLADADKMLSQKGGVAAGLKMEALDAVKKELDSYVRSAKRAVDMGQGGAAANEYRAFESVRKNLVDEMDALDVTAKAGPKALKPAGGLYKQAREKSGDYIRTSKAMEEGRDFMASGFDADLIKKHYKSLTPVEREAFKAGAVRRVYDARLNEMLDVSDFSVSSKIEGKEMMSRLKSFLSESDYQGFQKAIKDEERLVKFRNKIIGGSPTTPKALAAADFANSLGRDAVESVMTGGLQSIPRNTLVAGVKKMFDNLTDDSAKAVADILYETNPVKKIEIMKKLQGPQQKAVVVAAQTVDQNIKLVKNSAKIGASTAIVGGQ